jgi:antitoxin component YwqK of YwqJK toxin-antitoxin module
MKALNPLYLLLPFLTFFCGCAQKNQDDPAPVLTSIQVIDRNGFSETISAKNRLTKYQNVDFCNPQPYQKVLRVFSKNKKGQSSSAVTSYHGNGLIWQYLEVVDGRAHGTYREWHSNNHLKMELTIIEGIAELSETAPASWVFEGKNTIWDEKGALVAEILYEKGMLHGESLYYHPNGSIKKRIPYIQNKIQGSISFTSEEGVVLETIAYSDDKPHGQANSYTTENVLIYEEEWEAGSLLKGSYYAPDGAVFFTVTEGSGQRPEYENGTLKQLVEYQGGQAEGLVQCFDTTGFVINTYHQKNNKKHGEEKLFYPKSASGRTTQIKILLHWQEDILQGTVKTWFLDGVQESQKELYQNKKNGPSLAWYKDGNLMLSEEYENDLLASGTYYKKGDRKPVSSVSNKKGTASLYDPDGYFLKKIPYEKGLPLLDKE